MKKNKFWILLGLAILLSLGSQLLAQANRILTIAPTAQASSIGNVMLPMMNPARNLYNKDKFSFSRVNWMTNIVNDMSYNFIDFDTVDRVAMYIFEFTNKPTEFLPGVSAYENHQKLEPGVYIFVLQTDNRIKANKFTVVK